MYQDLALIFNFNLAPLAVGINYLYFRMKPGKYIVDDWSWLVKKFQKKVNNWTAKWLSRGGRLILSMAFLQQITVYWAHLYIIPKKILKEMAKFIWGEDVRKKPSILLAGTP